MDLFDTRHPNLDGQSWSIMVIMFIFDIIFPMQIAILGGRNPPFFSTGPMCPPPAMKGRSETAWRDATGRNRSDD